MNIKKLSNSESISLENDGLLIIKNFLNLSEIREIKMELANLLSCLIKRKVSTKAIENKISSISKKNPKIKKVFYERSQNLYSLYKLIINKKIKTLSYSILKTKNIGIWPRPQIRVDVKSDELNHIEWHHDYLYNKGSEKSYTFWIPLVNIDKSIGPLLVAKGSHKKNFDKKFYMQKGIKKFNFNIKKKDLQKLNIVELNNINGGDLVLMHCKTLHSGQINKSNKSRITILFRIQNLNFIEN